MRYEKYNFIMDDISESISLDAIDLALLDQLQADASLSNQDLAQRVHVSPPTCLRRVKRLRDAGLIERQVAILSADRLAPLLGHGLQAVVEITLDRQGQRGTGGLRGAGGCATTRCSSATAFRPARISS